MKSIYRMFKRGKYFYAEDTSTGKQESLHTSDRVEAQRLISAKNEAVNSKELTLAVGQVYLAAVDPKMLTRTWSEVMQVMSQRGGKSTQDRTLRALNSPAFDTIRNKVVIETTASDFLNVLADGKQSTNHYLKLLHGLAINLGWLVGRPVLPKKCWPKVAPKERRAITWEEHCKIVATEKNQERRLFYEMLWEIGSSQLDAALLSTANVNWNARTLIYHREKTGQQATISIGKRLEEILRQLPNEGLFFPKISKLSSTARAAEFNRRCKVVDIKGVSLHSYRYAWAERAFSAGYPERFAQAALGHESRAIHHAYAKRAKVNCPTLEDYEQKIIPLNVASANEALQQETQLPKSYTNCVS